MRALQILTLFIVLLCFGCGDSNKSKEKKEEPKERTTCEDTFPKLDECWELPKGYVHETLKAALKEAEKKTGVKPLRAVDEKKTKTGPCPKIGLHYDVVDRKDKHYGSIVSCPCCSENDNKAEKEWRYKYIQ